LNKKRSCNTSIFQALLKSKDILSLEAQNHISSFISSQKYEGGGFKDRAAKPDLYYSVFGYTLSLIFGVKLNVRQEESYLNSIDKSKLDFIHTVCLIRAQFLLNLIDLQQKSGFNLKAELTEGFIGNLLIKKISKSIKKENHGLFQVLDLYQSEDQGYNHNRRHEKQSTVYANFLIWTLFDDLGYDEKRLEEICRANQKLNLPNGSFANELNSSDGVTSATAAALIMDAEQEQSKLYLKDMYTRRGGFKASANVPITDLLSTATALLALKLSGEKMESFAENSLNFINLHWDESGGFFGSIADMTCDVEYTYYALLGIGVLS
jgi:prenyltransferase beta subunit